MTKDSTYSALVGSCDEYDCATSLSNAVTISDACVGATTAFRCGDTITESCTMDGNLSSTGTCFTIGANDLIIDGAGYSIIGSNSGIGIIGEYFNNTKIINLIINNFTTALYFNNTLNVSSINVQAINSNPDVILDGTANATFLNLSYDVSQVTVLNAAKGFFKWYLDVYVNDTSGNAIQNVNVTIKDKDSTTIFNGLTAVTGFITRQNITEYYKNSTISYYYTNLTFNATKTNYSYSLISSNITSNMQINLTIEAFPGQVNLTSPTNGNTTIHDRTPEFSWQAPTGTPTYYEINISSNFCQNINQQVNAPTTNYTPSTELCTKTDNDQPNIYYNWTVRACNEYGCGAYSNLWNFTIEPWVVITIENNTLDFGNMVLNQVKNTTSLTPMPFVLRNDGNVIADMINTSANESLWTSPGAGLGTSYFQMMAGETTETGSFNLSSSIMDWVNVGSNNQSVIHQLNYNDSKDSAYLHLQLTVPGDEPAGQKYTTLFFTWEQTP